MAIAALGGLLILGLTIGTDRRSGLAAIQYGIAASHPSVQHIDADDLSERRKRSMVIFDTRETEEFEVSHIAGAIRIAPNMPIEDFLSEFGDQIEGKTVVFYCSVGARSSHYAEQVQPALQLLGADSVVNLEFGLFGWHNERRPLVDKSGAATQLIHPYNDKWGQFVDRSALLSRKPKTF